mmetsp:Transcript_59332/g.105875  ORF Transcript_59332/g.105875 Transcript_59332/m.105875 type:complete len:234 (+) Transcript_59332:356-1057(+)
MLYSCDPQAAGHPQPTEPLSTGVSLQAVVGPLHVVGPDKVFGALRVVASVVLAAVEGLHIDFHPHQDVKVVLEYVPGDAVVNHGIVCLDVQLTGVAMDEVPMDDPMFTAVEAVRTLVLGTIPFLASEYLPEGLVAYTTFAMALDHKRRGQGGEGDVWLQAANPLEPRRVVARGILVEEYDVFWQVAVVLDDELQVWGVLLPKRGLWDMVGVPSLGVLVRVDRQIVLLCPQWLV